MKVGLAAEDQAADRYRAHVREAAVDQAAAALRRLIPADVLDDDELRQLAAAAVDAAMPVIVEQADLFGSDGRKVERLYRALDAARWEAERLRLDHAAQHAIHHANGEGALP